MRFGGRVTILHDTNYVETPTDWADLNHATSVAGNLAAGNEAYSIVLLPLPDEMNKIRVPDEWHRTYPRYDSMLVNASAKNVLAIGATHKDDVICAFSSQGPGFDGRIGPHLVGPGFDMLTLASGNEYAHGSGTSGSCPMVAGVAALLIDQYRKIHPTDPSAELIKAILFNSARDLRPAGLCFGHLSQ